MADQLSTDEDSNSLMNRIEEKFIVNRDYLDQITSALRENLKDGDIDTNVRFNTNQTIYMDNKDMDIYRDTLDNIRPRFKIRIRRYAPNEGSWEDVAYVELKVKTETKLTKKVRIRIPENMILKVVEKQPIIIDDVLVNLNRDISKEVLIKRATVINELISKYGLHRQITVMYQRRAYSDQKIRVTVDDKLIYLLPSPIAPEISNMIKSSNGWEDSHKMYDKIKDGNFLIVEVKHENGIPGWVQNLLNQVKAEKVKFSKYGASVTSLLNTDQNDVGFMTKPTPN
jgi:SPX domain protein involved in polyphosphate accumulation